MLRSLSTASSGEILLLGVPPVYPPVGRTVHASRGATQMQYRWPVSDCSCHDGAVRTSATLMTRPHAAFAHHSILRVRIRCYVWLRHTPVGRTCSTAHASRGATPMQYPWPVSDRSCHDSAVRSSATLMTRPHAAFAQHSILGLRIRCRVCLRYILYRLSVAHCTQAVEQLRCNAAGP